MFDSVFYRANEDRVVKMGFPDSESRVFIFLKTVTDHDKRFLVE